jgi:hypothetical protein
MGCGVSLQDGGIVPNGIFQIIKLIEIQRDTLPHEQLLKKIGVYAAGKHSDNFQFFHAFFRGQDKQTNYIYGILKTLATDFSCDVISKRLNRFSPEAQEHQTGLSPLITSSRPSQ